jgi:hypothetical protein
VTVVAVIPFVDPKLPVVINDFNRRELITSTQSKLVSSDHAMIQFPVSLASEVQALDANVFSHLN